MKKYLLGLLSLIVGGMGIAQAADSSFFTVPKVPEGAEVITLGAGCFWCTEAIFQQVPGVLTVTSGYMGGTTKRPTYQQVCTGRTGHAEAVRIEFDPAQVSYEELARLLFEIHDPTELNFQGPDVGPQYRSAIFYFSDQQIPFRLRLAQFRRRDRRRRQTAARCRWPAH